MAEVHHRRDSRHGVHATGGRDIGEAHRGLVAHNRGGSRRRGGQPRRGRFAGSKARR